MARPSPHIRVNWDWAVARLPALDQLLRRGPLPLAYPYRPLDPIFDWEEETLWIPRGDLMLMLTILADRHPSAWADLEANPALDGEAKLAAILHRVGQWLAEDTRPPRLSLPDPPVTTLVWSRPGAWDQHRPEEEGYLALLYSPEEDVYRFHIRQTGTTVWRRTLRRALERHPGSVVLLHAYRIPDVARVRALLGRWREEGLFTFEAGRVQAYRLRRPMIQELLLERLRAQIERAATV